MRKIFLFLSLLFSFTGLISVCSAENITFEDYQYRLLADGFAEITGYTGSAPEIIIPENINDHTVTSIGENAFYGNETLEKVILPAGIKMLGDHSFAECTLLENITLPDGLLRIGDLVFQGDVLLHDIGLPSDLIYIGMNPFDRCDALEEIIFPEGNNFYMTEDGVLFDSSTKVLISYPGGKPDKTYSVPDQVTKIAAAAFSENNHLEEIDLPDTAAEMDGNPFCGCTNLRSVAVSPLNPVFQFRSGALFNNQTRELITYLWEDEPESYTVPNGIVSISQEAFYKHKELKTIELPKTLTRIGDAAFAESGLTSITIPDNVIMLGNSTFSECTELKSVRLPSVLPRIGKYTFSGCTVLESVSFPKSLYMIDEGAFFRCAALTELIFPENLRFIGNFAFLECSSLTFIDFSDHLLSIGKGAFFGPEDLSVSVSPGSLAEEWAVQNDVPYTHKDINYFIAESA